MIATAAQVHAVLGVKPGTLRQWVHRGHITKVGHDAYDWDSINAYLRRRVAAQRHAHDGEQDASLDNRPGQV